MAIVLSPTALGGIMQCPYKYYNSVYVAEPTNVIHGALMNSAACAAVVGTNNKLTPRIHYYDNYVNTKLEKKKQLNTDILKQGMGKLYKFLKGYVNENYQIRIEQKLEYPWDRDNEDVWISGQPDVVILYNNPNRENEIVCEIIDVKCGKISWYSKPEIWLENGQRYFYSRLLFQHFSMEFKEHNFEKPKIKFSFAVVDKGTGDLELFSKTLDEYTVELQMKHHIKAFRELQKQNLDKKDYPATKCRGCAFCEFADTCPLKKGELSVSSEELDELF